MIVPIVYPYNMRLYLSFVFLIGYKPFMSSDFFLQDGDELDMDTVSLDLTVLAGSEIDVRAERSLQKVEVDKKIYNIEQLKTTAGGTCCDVMKKIPSLDKILLDKSIAFKQSSPVL